MTPDEFTAFLSDLPDDPRSLMSDSDLAKERVVSAVLDEETGRPGPVLIALAIPVVALAGGALIVAARRTRDDDVVRDNVRNRARTPIWGGGASSSDYNNKKINTDTDGGTSTSATGNNSTAAAPMRKSGKFSVAGPTRSVRDAGLTAMELLRDLDRSLGREGNKNLLDPRGERDTRRGRGKGGGRSGKSSGRGDETGGGGGRGVGGRGSVSIGTGRGKARAKKDRRSEDRISNATVMMGSAGSTSLTASPSSPSHFDAGREAEGGARLSLVAGDATTLLIPDTNCYVSDLRRVRQLFEQVRDAGNASRANSSSSGSGTSDSTRTPATTSTSTSSSPSPSPSAATAFSSSPFSSVILPATVVAELDGLQYAVDKEVAYRARSALSLLDDAVGLDALQWLRRARQARSRGDPTNGSGSTSRSERPLRDELACVVHHQGEWMQVVVSAPYSDWKTGAEGTLGSTDSSWSSSSDSATEKKSSSNPNTWSLSTLGSAGSRLRSNNNNQKKKEDQDMKILDGATTDMDDRIDVNDVAWWAGRPTGDKELLSLCMGLREAKTWDKVLLEMSSSGGAACANADADAHADATRRAPDANDRSRLEVVLLTGDKALQLEAMLEGVLTMSIAAWGQWGQSPWWGGGGKGGTGKHGPKPPPR